MATNLTPQFIRAMVPPSNGNRVEWDAQERGLGIRITKAGHRAFVLRYIAQGRERRMTLGEFPTLSLTAARAMARGEKGNVIKGADPLDAKAALRRAMTLGKAVESYVSERVGEQKPRTQLETRRALETHWAPLHPLPLATVTRSQVAARLSEIAQRSGPVAANRARSQLSALYRWAIAEGLTEANPVAGTNKREEKPRERVLSGDELRDIWNATERVTDYHSIVRLLLLTGQRREEIASLLRSEIAASEPRSALLRFPGERTKNGLAHDVPLSAPALAALARHPEPEAGDELAEAGKATAPRALVFGRGEGGYSGWSRSKARLDASIALARAKAAGRKEATDADQPMPWTLHDLRRTMVTGMAELGVQPHVIEAVVNHVSGHKAGVAGIYNRATYAAEKRAALARWADHVMALVAGQPSNVVPLRRETA